MTASVRTILLAALLSAATGTLYFWRLGDAPTLTRDEAFVALCGRSLSVRGRDLEGRSFPLYVRSTIDGNWWPPILPYAVAAVLKVLPFSEVSVRAPMALAAVANVLLVFFIARLLFARDDLALMSAALLAMTPAQVIANRYANDPGLPATFVLAWLLLALTYCRTGHRTVLFLAGLALGVGVYSYVGAVPRMPLYMAVTAVALWRRHDMWRRYMILAAGFAIPTAIGLPWLMLHPDVFRTIFLHYQSDPRAIDVGAAVTLLTSLQRAIQIGILYVEFWDPRFLFVHGADALLYSTRHVGVYLVPMAGLTAIGVIQAARRAAVDARMLLLIGGFLVAPLASCLVDFHDHLASQAIWRASEVLGLGALIATVGVETVLTAKRRGGQLLTLGVAVLLPVSLVAFAGSSFPHREAMLIGLSLPVLIAGSSRFGAIRRAMGGRLAVLGVLAMLGVVSVGQFADFYHDYFTDYRTALMNAADGNMRDLLETVIVRASAGPASWIYLGFRLGPADWGGNYWKFYVYKHRREDLLRRTVNDENASQFDHTHICQMPSGSLLTTRIGWDAATDSLIGRMIASGELVREGAIGWPIYWLMRTTDTCTPAANTVR